MDSEAYWAQRAEEREQYWHKKCQETIERELASYYRASLGRIQTEIAALYGRFAVDNELTMAEARKLLKGNEFRQWRMDIKEYVKKIEATGDKGLERELNVLAMRSRISRLDKLYSETLMELDKLGRNVSKSMKSFLTDAYKDNYYHGLYDIAKAGELQNAVSKVDSKALEDVLRTRWSGKNYSERIWKNQKLLAQTIKAEMMTAVHRGESVEKISKRVAKRMDVGISNARRLVRTEMSYVNNHAAMDSISDAGMKYFKFIATLDRRTSAICRSHDGHVYALKEASLGTNVPPLHPNCRSTIAGSLYGPGKAKTGTRIARKDDGKSIYVPADMTYDDWKAVYVDKSKTLTEWQEAREAAAKAATKAAASGIMAIKTALYGHTQKLKKCMSEDDYEAYIKTLTNNASVRNLYINYADDIQSISKTADGGVYRRGANTIEFSYPAERYIKGGQSKYSTLAHEYGHFFDVKIQMPKIHFSEIDAIKAGLADDDAGIPAWLNSYFPHKASYSDEFLAAIRKDKEQLRQKSYDDIYKELRPYDASAGVQDAYDGFFIDQRIGWGHGEKYYNRVYSAIKREKLHSKLKRVYADRKLQAKNQTQVKEECRIYDAASEAWANILSAITNGGKELEYIKKYLPNSYQQALDILKEDKQP